MTKRKVLVTGASGYVAAQLLPSFREQYDCLLVDVRTTDRDGNRIDGLREADLTAGLEPSRALFQGVDTVVHLGYVQPPGGSAGTSPENYLIERRNVDMAHTVLQLSHDEGARRVILASSN